MSPPHVSIIPVDSEADVANFNASEETADYFLPALKSRRLDPKFKDDAGRIHRLSEVDDNYASLMRQQMQYMKQAYVARIHLNKETKQLLIRDRNYDESLWQDALKRPRMSEEVFITLLNKTAETAANGSMARIDWMR